MAKKRKEYKHVIITDEKGKPMAWSGDQLCYCTYSTWQDEHNPVTIYTIARAKRLIKKSIDFRNGAGFSISEYKTMPIDLAGYLVLRRKKGVPFPTKSLKP